MKRKFLDGFFLLAVFAFFTFSLTIVDVRAIGPEGSCVGYAAVNGFFHELTGVHWTLYLITDWAGAGATIPLTGFGNTLAKGVREAVDESGWIGIFTGGLKAGAGGITAAVLFGWLAALLFSSRDKS